MHIEFGVPPTFVWNELWDKVAGGWRQYVPPKRRWIPDNTVLHPEDGNQHSDAVLTSNPALFVAGRKIVTYLVPWICFI
jgi:hypothetical protein